MVEPTRLKTSGSSRNFVAETAQESDFEIREFGILKVDVFDVIILCQTFQDYGQCGQLEQRVVSRPQAGGVVSALQMLEWACEVSKAQADKFCDVDAWQRGEIFLVDEGDVL